MLPALIELHHQDSWEILDPNTAQVVAVFYDHRKAIEYQAILNFQLQRGG